MRALLALLLCIIGATTPMPAAAQATRSTPARGALPDETAPDHLDRGVRLEALPARGPSVPVDTDAGY